MLCLVSSGCAAPTFVAGWVTLETDVSDGQLILRTMEGEPVLLTGEQVGELARVPGANVRVTGRERGLGENRRIEVDRYRLIETGNGVAPHVGTVKWDGADLFLEEEGEGPVVRLVGSRASELRPFVGAKVWVNGLIVKSEQLHVADFGLLKPALR